MCATLVEENASAVNFEAVTCISSETISETRPVRKPVELWRGEEGRDVDRARIERGEGWQGGRGREEEEEEEDDGNNDDEEEEEGVGGGGGW